MRESLRLLREKHAAIASEADRRAREAMPCDADLADRVAGLLSYRPGVPTFPKELPQVARDLHAAGLGYENLRFLWTGAFNLHRLVEKRQEEKAALLAERDRFKRALSEISASAETCSCAVDDPCHPCVAARALEGSS